MQSSTPDPTWSLYPYTPSKPLPIIFAVLILALGLALAIQSFTRPRWPHFGLIVSWATLVWLAGFSTRAASAWTPALQQYIPLYIAQYVLILMGPPLYAAAEYFVLGRLMAFLPFHAPVHPGRVLSTFLLLSAGVEGLTAGGAASSASPGALAAARDAGLACVCAALVLQALVEVAFIGLVAVMEVRARRSGHFVRRVRAVCYVLYVTSAMMLVRCVVRAVEGFEARSCPVGDVHCGGVSTHEWVLWVFEVGNIALLVAVLAVLHPRRFLPADHRVFLDAVDCTTERAGPGFKEADKRSLWLTVADPFDFMGIVGGRGRRIEPFWERPWPAVGHDVEKLDKESASDETLLRG